MRRPSFVRSPLSLSEPSAYSVSRARTIISCGGGSRKSKFTKLFMPMDFSSSTTDPRFVRYISGIVLSSSSCWKDHAVYSLKHLPGATRPALPARWFADAFEIGVTIRLSIPVRGLKVVYLPNPVSITNTILSIVIDVSAMLVASTTFREPGGVGSKILAYRSEGNEEYIGQIINSATLDPKPLMRAVIISSAYSISSCPVRKTRISPLL